MIGLFIFHLNYIGCILINKNILLCNTCFVNSHYPHIKGDKGPSQRLFPHLPPPPHYKEKMAKISHFWQFCGFLTPQKRISPLNAHQYLVPPKSQSYLTSGRSKGIPTKEKPNVAPKWAKLNHQVA